MNVWAGIILASVAGYLVSLARINDGAFIANMTETTGLLAVSAVHQLAGCSD